MKALSRRLLCCAATLLISSAAAAQTYPSSPLRIIVPFPVGGVSDSLARALGEKLTQRLHQPVLVENKSGANTIIGAQAALAAKPDGYTLLMATDVTMSELPYLYDKLPFNPFTDLQPISIVAQTTEFLVVSEAVPANSVAELVSYAKSAPGTLSYGSQGQGSTGHLAGVAFSKMAGIEILHVPYRGLADVVTAMLGNHTQIALASIFPMLPHIKAGKLKPLAVISERRSPLLPDVPTIAEAGYPRLQSMAWFGLVAASPVPRAIVDTLSAEVQAIIADPDFRQKFILSAGLEPVGNTVDEFAAFLKKDREKYATQIREAGVKLE